MFISVLIIYLFVFIIFMASVAAFVVSAIPTWVWFAIVIALLMPLWRRIDAWINRPRGTAVVPTDTRKGQDVSHPSDWTDET